jgi:hypothetical protein
MVRPFEGSAGMRATGLRLHSIAKQQAYRRQLQIGNCGKTEKWNMIAHNIALGEPASCPK